MPRVPVKERPARGTEAEGPRSRDEINALTHHLADLSLAYQLPAFASIPPIHQLLLGARVARLAEATEVDDSSAGHTDAGAWELVPEPGPLASDVWPLEILRRQYEELPASHRRTVFRALQRSLDLLETDETFDQELWGPPPDVEDALEVSFRNAISRSEAEAEFAAQCIGVEEAARRLDWQTQAVRAALEANELIGFEHDGSTLLPVWQFSGDGRILEGVDRVWSSFPGSAMWLSSWVTSPHPDLEGATPRELLVEGEVDRVVQLVRAMHG